MRFVVLGAGAIGCVIGGRLFEHGHDVVLIARGAQYEAIRDQGLTIESADGSVNVRIPVVSKASEIDFQSNDVVILTVKTQDTAEALRTLAYAAPNTTPIVCAQNGVEGERIALRMFTNVYGMCVMCPTTYLEPGKIHARMSPKSGILDLGRYPSGVDATATGIAEALENSTFLCNALPTIMRQKYSKLLTAIANPIEAIFGLDARTADGADRILELVKAVKAEGVACLRAAGIDYASDDEEAARRSQAPRTGQIGFGSGLSGWQSLERGTGSIESDFFNGEIALLGRMHGIATPVNSTIQQFANQMAHDRALPGSVSRDAFFAALERASSTR